MTEALYKSISAQLGEKYKIIGPCSECGDSTCKGEGGSGRGCFDWIPDFAIISAGEANKCKSK